MSIGIEGCSELHVQHYLSLDRALFLQPQYNMRLLGNSCFDFVCLDFRTKTVWIVEVSVGNSFLGKLEQFRRGEIVPELKQQMSEFGQADLIKDWRFGFWFFGKRYYKRFSDDQSSFGPIQFSALEDVMVDLLSGKAWNDRAEALVVT